MKLFYINSPWKAARAIFAWPLLIFGCYMLAGWIGSSIAVNGEWRPAQNGIDIFLETNGVHVSLIVPMSAAGEDLRDLVRPTDLSDPDFYGTHAMIGWGHGAVYRNTASWSDLRSRDAVSAIFGSGDTLLHVYHRVNPRPNSIRKKIRVSSSEYGRIMKQIRNKFRLNANGRSVPSKAYAQDNVFYDSHGQYNAFMTCNEWTRQVLANAGVKTGLWTPMAGGVMKWY